MYMHTAKASSLKFLKNIWLRGRDPWPTRPGRPGSDPLHVAVGACLPNACHKQPARSTPGTCQEHARSMPGGLERTKSAAGTTRSVPGACQGCGKSMLRLAGSMRLSPLFLRLSQEPSRTATACQERAESDRERARRMLGATRIVPGTCQEQPGECQKGARLRLARSVPGACQERAKSVPRACPERIRSMTKATGSVLEACQE